MQFTDPVGKVYFFRKIISYPKYPILYRTLCDPKWGNLIKFKFYKKIFHVFFGIWIENMLVKRPTSEYYLTSLDWLLGFPVLCTIFSQPAAAELNIFRHKLYHIKDCITPLIDILSSLKKVTKSSRMSDSFGSKGQVILLYFLSRIFHVKT